MRRASGPGEPDLDPSRLTELRYPSRDVGRVGIEIWNVCRDRFERRVEYARKTRQVDVEIEMRHRFRLGAIEHPIDAREPARQAFEPFANLQQHRRAQRLDQRRVADELDDVAEALLRTEQDDLAGQILARPDRTAEAGPKLQQRCPHPAKLVLVPPFRQAAGGQQRVRVVVVPGEAGAGGKMLLVQSDRVVCAPAFAQVQCEIDEILDVLAAVCLDPVRPLERFERFVWRSCSASATPRFAHARARLPSSESARRTSTSPSCASC